MDLTTKTTQDVSDSPGIMTGDDPCSQMAAKPAPTPTPPVKDSSTPAPSSPSKATPKAAESVADLKVNGGVDSFMMNGNTDGEDPLTSPVQKIQEETVSPLKANRLSRGSNLMRLIKRKSYTQDDDPMGAQSGGGSLDRISKDSEEEDSASVGSQESGDSTGTPGAAKEKPRSNSLRKRLGNVIQTGSTSSLSSPRDASDEEGRDPSAILTRQLSRKNSHSKNPINENEWARLLLLFMGTVLGWLLRALLFLWRQAWNFFGDEAADSGSAQPQREPVEAVPLIPLKPEIKETGKKERIFHICNELKNTEEVYVDRLQILVMAKERATIIVGAYIAKQMFKDIEVICLFHKDYFLPDLKERMEKWEDHKKIGDIMWKLTPYLKLYTEYVKHFQKASALVDHWENKSSAFATMIRDIRDNQAIRHGKLKVQAHMIEPIQRVPRYELLLRDYLKRLSDDAPDKQDSERALESVAQAASHFEDVMKRDSRIAKLIEIRERIDWVVNIVLPSREFISENKLNIFSQRTQKPSEKTTFLFNDLFIVCSQQKIQKIMTSMKLKVKVAIDIREAELITGTNLDIPHTLWVQTKENQVELCFSSSSEMMQWRQTLQGLIDTFTKTLARNSTCSSMDSTDGDDTLEVVHEGHVHVSSDDARTWRRRWVVVGTCGRLFANKTQQDKVPLSWIRIVRFNLESAQHSKKPNTLLLQGFGRKYFLHFDNQNECNEWFEVLQRYQETSSSDTPFTLP